VLLGCLRVLGLSFSERKNRLSFCAVARLEFGWCRNFWFREAVPAAEEWADAGEPPADALEVRQNLTARATPGWWSPPDWFWVALGCVQDRPLPDSWRRTPGAARAFVSAYRELIENPFVPIGWKHDWKTSTVLDLARTIYDRHAFDVMPILADALLDAGCDHQLVQEHCRSGRPHARGCWVLDALLELS
jgi:hypothetical protein